MIIAAQSLRATRIGLVLAVVFTDGVLLLCSQDPWNDYWLFAVGCWTVLNLYWWHAARNSQPAPGSLILWLVSLAEFPLCCLPLSSVPILGQRLAPRFAAVELLGAVLCAVGAGLAIWSRRVLAASWNNLVTLRAGHALVQTGPYAILRHPMYCGFIMGSIGMILVLGEVRALVLLLDIGVFFRRMKPEESILRATYPKEYPEYERRVRRLLPWIW